MPDGIQPSKNVARYGPKAGQSPGKRQSCRSIGRPRPKTDQSTIPISTSSATVDGALRFTSFVLRENMSLTRILRTSTMKYSDLVVDWLSELGYTHCFFVGGGNIMHLLDGVRSRMKCIPVVHEVAAGIATEYFNESKLNGERAFAMVTAGPG